MGMMNEYYTNLPKKRMAAGALIFNTRGEVLIVRPSYKDLWSIPGGVVDERESPREACMREIQEEIGIDISVGRLLCVDHMHETQEKSESLQFIFYGGVLQDEHMQKICVDGKEILEYRFMRPEEAIEFFGGTEHSFAKRAAKALEILEEGGDVYLEDGE